MINNCAAAAGCRHMVVGDEWGDLRWASGGQQCFHVSLWFLVQCIWQVLHLQQFLLLLNVQLFPILAKSLHCYCNPLLCLDQDLCGEHQRVPVPCFPLAPSSFAQTHHCTGANFGVWCGSLKQDSAPLLVIIIYSLIHVCGDMNIVMSSNTAFFRQWTWYENDRWKMKQLRTWTGET